MADTTSTPREARNFTPRPTIYNGVQMRSRLEAAWAEQFDALGWHWEYEPICVATEKGQYLPDFRIKIPGALGDVYVEVKPGSWTDMENWGFCGDLYGDLDAPDGWNTACARRAAEIDRMAAAVAANVHVHLFLLCLGSGGEHRGEECSILAPGSDLPLVPVRCEECLSAFLVRHPLTVDSDFQGIPIVARRRCPDHRGVLISPFPVPSLYAKGWTYHGGTYERDPFDARLRGD